MCIKFVAALDCAKYEFKEIYIRPGLSAPKTKNAIIELIEVVLKKYDTSQLFYFTNYLRFLYINALIVFAEGMQTLIILFNSID